MTRQCINESEKLSQGGRVVAGTGETNSNGKGVARVGDRATCAIDGSATIVSGDATVIIDGQPVARDGDRTACGATLVASQAMTYLR